MTGAEKIVRTLEAGGVDVCFTNPGTSEMHFVAALDRTERMRSVLGLFEGVATGAADGYFRMARRPAATLLHLGPGLANGVANLHNAKKAFSGIVNIIGEHATYHIRHNAPLMSDIEGIAGPVSHFVARAGEADGLAEATGRAVAVAAGEPPGIAALIVPADISWSPAGGEAVPGERRRAPKVPAERVLQAAQALRKGSASLLLVGGVGRLEPGARLAGRISARTGCQLRAPIFNARARRGAGQVEIPRIPHAPGPALEALSSVSTIVLCGASRPVSSFAFPDYPNVLSAPGCAFVELAALDEDIVGALADLADELDACHTPPESVSQRGGSAPATGRLEADGIARAIAAALPEEAIIIDEAVSSGRGFAAITARAAAHDWLQNMGGSIGFGMPNGIGAAIACPERKVLCMVGDGSAMYTIQSLWTMARENLDITVLIFSNGGYKSLKAQLPRVGIDRPGRNSIDMLSLERPALDWPALAKGHGVEAARVDDLEGLSAQLRRGFGSPGPYLIELVLA